MTDRDWFAAFALAGKLAKPYTDIAPAARVREAYALADLMVQARSQWDPQRHGEPNQDANQD